MTSSFTIPDDEQAQLRELARTTKDKKTADRIRIILALAAGDRACDVARIFCIDEPTVRKWKNRYQKRRLFSDWLASLQTGYSGKLMKDQLTEIEHYVEAEMVTDAATIVSFIKDKFNKDYTVDGVTKLLHRLGFVYK
jgi:transposase